MSDGVMTVIHSNGKLYYPAWHVDALAARLAEAERLILQLPCRCINLGDGEYVECDRCLFLHGTAEQESDDAK